MWEFTSIRGLNHAVRGDESCSLRTVDLRTGEVCADFGFDVGQPLADPPIHKSHRNLGLGRVERIYAFPSLHQLTFAFAFGGGRFVLDFDGRHRDLLVTLHALAPAPHVRHVLVTRRGEREVRPGHRYEVGASIREVPGAGRARVPDLGEAEALRQCVYGNAVRAPGGELYLPVNRAWVTMFGRMFGEAPGFAGPLLFIWDAAFGSVLAAQVDLDLALSNLRLLCAQLDDDGWWRQLRVGERTNNLTGLPVVSLAVQVLYERTRDDGILREFFDRLLRANRWLRRHRDRNDDGLLEWGYEPAGHGIDVPGRWAPGYESGLDDSPMWQDEPVDETRRCFTCSAVDLNSLHAYDCLLLARMAKELKRPDDEVRLRADYEATRRLIERTLWDEARGLYANRRWSGELAAEVSPTSFFPLLAGAVPPPRAARLVRHLDDETSFGGEWRLPSVARSSPRFSPAGDYWRGRIWPPLNYLVQRGLREYDSHAAERLHADSKRLFLREWLEHGHVHENYRADTGWGEAPETYYRSCPFYTWGGLLLL